VVAATRLPRQHEVDGGSRRRMPLPYFPDSNHHCSCNGVLSREAARRRAGGDQPVRAARRLPCCDAAGWPDFPIRCLPVVRNVRAYVDTGPVPKYWAQKRESAGLASTRTSSAAGAVPGCSSGRPDDWNCRPIRRRSTSAGVAPAAWPRVPPAIVAPGVLDARLCISYLTIELRGRSGGSAPLVGGVSSAATIARTSALEPVRIQRRSPVGAAPGLLTPCLAEYLRLTPAGFRRMFAGTNVLRARHRASSALPGAAGNLHDRRCGRTSNDGWKRMTKCCGSTPPGR